MPYFYVLLNVFWTFEHLLSMVAQFISKNDTHFRKYISAAERLALTLGFFATGDAQQVFHICTCIYRFEWNPTFLQLFTPCISVNPMFFVRHFAFVVKTMISPYLFHWYFFQLNWNKFFVRHFSNPNLYFLHTY